MKPKTFDCVQMKYDIQQQLLKEMAGLTPRQRHEHFEEHVNKDPILGPFWRRARRVARPGTVGRNP